MQKAIPLERSQPAALPTLLWAKLFSVAALLSGVIVLGTVQADRPQLVAAAESSKAPPTTVSTLDRGASCVVRAIV